MTTHKGYKRLGLRAVSERNVQDAIMHRLQVHGWVVRSLSQPRRVQGGLVGVPDVIAFKAGVTMLVEVKRPGGKRRESQVEFAEQLRPELRTTLCYKLADDVDEFADWLGAVEATAGVDTVRVM